MMAELEQKKKRRPKSYFDNKETGQSAVYQMAVDRDKVIKKIDDEFVPKIQDTINKIKKAETTKKELILEYAKTLDDSGEAVLERSICLHVCKKLEGIVNRDYVIRCLPEEYKNASILRGVNARRPKSTNTKKGKKSDTTVNTNTNQEEETIPLAIHREKMMEKNAEIKELKETIAKQDRQIKDLEKELAVFQKEVNK